MSAVVKGGSSLVDYVLIATALDVCYHRGMITLQHDGSAVPIHFVTSDQHVSHVNIARFTGRPFDNSESTDDMDNALINAWNSVVRQDDNVLLLGDIALGNIEKSLAKWRRFLGVKYLVPGNHDRVSSVESQARQERFRPMYEEAGFIILPETVELDVDLGDRNVSILASHYPYVGDSHDNSRYDELRPVDDGRLLLHGHTHSPHITQDEFPRQYHVGADAHNMIPVAASVIGQWVADNS